MSLHLFVVDPLAGIDITKDSSFALMLAAQGRGDEVWSCDTDGLSAQSGVQSARAPWTIGRPPRPSTSGLPSEPPHRRRPSSICAAGDDPNAGRPCASPL